MDASPREKVNQYLKFLKEQIEAGLIILKSSRSFVDVEESLLADDYKQALSWKEILSNLAKNQSVFFYINGEFSKELYDIFIQYSNRGGVIQISNPQNMDLIQIEFNPKKTHLVYVITKDTVGIAQAKYGLLNKAGLVENIE